LERIKFKFRENTDYNFDKDFYCSIYERFIKLFLPDKVPHKNKKWQDDEIELCKWIFSHFRYQNDIINPRVLVSFFNNLFRNQYEYYDKNPTKLLLAQKSMVKHKKKGGFSSLDIFIDKIIESTYNIIRNEELKNIYFLLNDPIEKILFREIVKTSYRNGIYKKDLSIYKTYNIEINQYDRLIKYLVILGFFKMNLPALKGGVS
jgi:hypothetical protein